MASRMNKRECVGCKRSRWTRRTVNVMHQGPEKAELGHLCKPCRRKAGLDFGEPAAQPHPKRNKHKAKVAQPKKAGKKKRGEE